MNGWMRQGSERDAVRCMCDDHTYSYPFIDDAAASSSHYRTHVDGGEGEGREAGSCRTEMEMIRRGRTRRCR